MTIAEIHRKQKDQWVSVVWSFGLPQVVSVKKLLIVLVSLIPAQSFTIKKALLLLLIYLFYFNLSFFFLQLLGSNIQNGLYEEHHFSGLEFLSFSCVYFIVCKHIWHMNIVKKYTVPVQCYFGRNTSNQICAMPFVLIWHTNYIILELYTNILAAKQNILRNQTK